MEPFSVGRKTDARIAEDNSSVHHEGGGGERARVVNSGTCHSIVASAANLLL